MVNRKNTPLLPFESSPLLNADLEHFGVILPRRVLLLENRRWKNNATDVLKAKGKQRTNTFYSPAMLSDGTISELKRPPLMRMLLKQGTIEIQHFDEQGREAQRQKASRRLIFVLHPLTEEHLEIMEDWPNYMDRSLLFLIGAVHDGTLVNAEQDRSYLFEGKLPNP